MAKPDFLLCDKCGDKLPTDCHLQLAHKSVTDAAGSRDQVYFEVDLCHRCLVAAVTSINLGNYFVEEHKLARSMMDFVDPEWREKVGRPMKEPTKDPLGEDTCPQCVWTFKVKCPVCGHFEERGRDDR